MSGYSANPKPLAFPVSLSITRRKFNTLPALLKISTICSSVRPAGYQSLRIMSQSGTELPYGMLPTKTDLEGGLVDILGVRKARVGYLWKQCMAEKDHRLLATEQIFRNAGG